MNGGDKVREPMSAEAEGTAAPTDRALPNPRGRAALGARPIIAMGVFVSVALIALLGFELWRERGEIEAQAFRETRNVATLLETHVGQSMSSAAEVLRAFAARAQIALREGSVNSAEFGTEVAILPEGHPQIDGLILADASGRVLISTATNVVSGEDLSSQDYFQRIVANPEAQATLDNGALRRNVQDGRWFIPLSRGVQDANGRLVGVVVVVIDPRPFVSFFGALDIDQFSAVTLMQNDGVIVARSPDEDKFVGRTVVGGELDRSIAAQSSAGSVRIRGLLYGRDLFMSYRAIAGTPYVINVAFDANDVLLPWYRLAGLYAMLGFVLVCAIATSVWLVRQDQARKATLAAGRQVHEIIEGMSAQVALLERDGTVIEVNRALLNSAGLTRADVIGRRLWDTFWYAYSADSQRRVRSAIERAASGEPARSDLTLRVGKSAFATVDTTFQPIDEPADGRKRIIASGLEVTERRQLELKLAQSQKLEAIGLVAGGIAHDFNNLLGAIANFASFLVDDLKGRKTELTYATRIAEACEYGKEVVTQLLAYARPTSEARSRTDLRTVLSQMEMLVRPSLPPSIELLIETPKAPVIVIASKSQLTQVLVNLCINARDAMAKKGGAVCVRLSTVSPSDPDHPAADAPTGPGMVKRRSGSVDPTKSYGLVTVADTGTGIDADTIDRIFEPFFSTKPRGKGTGLGLAIVDSAILSLGGMYAVESRRGEGTCFSIYLPLEQADAPAASPAERSPDARVGTV
jgi:PAS domain S-box-containing protein